MPHGDVCGSWSTYIQRAWIETLRFENIIPRADQFLKEQFVDKITTLQRCQDPQKVADPDLKDWPQKQTPTWEFPLIGEKETWFHLVENEYTNIISRENSSVSLLSGPCGSGKSTIHVPNLCYKLLDLKELT